MGLDGSGDRRIAEDCSSPAASPDGRRIVFVGGPYGREIGLMNADGSGRRTAHRCGLYHADPTWTPDGSHVVFVEEFEDGKGVGAIMLLDLGNSRVERITTVGEDPSR